MVTLDNLVVTTALPSIRARPRRVDRVARVDRQRLHAGLRRAAAHRRRARRPLRPPADVRRSASALFTLPRARRRARADDRRADRRPRASRALGAAIVTPLTLTLLSEAVPPERRGLALGAWSGISGLGVALGPLVGGAVVEGISWHWIFWLNVPIGLVAAPAGRAPPDRVLRPGRRARPARPRRSPALGLLGVVFGIVRGDALGWTSADRRSRSIGARRRAAGRVRGLGAARAGADAADALLPLARLRGDQRRLVRDVLRRLRLDLPARAVLPDRAGLRRRCEAGLRTLPWTGDADARRARSPALLSATGSARGR